jgi:photosystem II stability/assembly factor-like uncharacterized protein
LSFVDDKAGWIYTSETLNATVDGGETMVEIIPPEDIQDIIAVSLRTPSDGYLLDDAGVLYITQDGGQSWTANSLGLKLEDRVIVPNLSSPSAAVRFADADNGLVVLNYAGGGEIKILALRTADGGQTWTQEDVMSTVAGAIVHLSPDGEYVTLYDSGEFTVLHY